jgi:hypothetical protein
MIARRWFERNLPYADQVSYNLEALHDNPSRKPREQGGRGTLVDLEWVADWLG